MTTRNDTNDQVNKAAEAGKNAADEAARTARTVTDEAAKVGEQTARASADLTRQGAETARKNLQAGLDTAAQTFQRMTDQFTQVLGFNGPQSEELARRSSQNLQAVSQASTIIVKGAQDASREVVQLGPGAADQEHGRAEPPCGLPVGAGLCRHAERSGAGRPAAGDRHQQAHCRAVGAGGR